MSHDSVPSLQKTITTAASRNHFNCLKNLLYTIRRFEGHARTVVYDLGLGASQRNSLIESGLDVRVFPFSDYPAYVNIVVNRGEYAWKPIIVDEVLNEFGGSVLWLDAGNLVMGSLINFWDSISRCGVVTPTSSGKLCDWTHPGTLQFLNAPQRYLELRNRTGAIVGFNAELGWPRQLCQQWKECALSKSCIAPEGSSRENHRQDQAVLSVLYYRYHDEYRFDLVNSVDEISRHNDRLRLREAKLLLNQAERVRI